MFGRIEDIVRTSGKRVRDASGFTVENKGTRDQRIKLKLREIGF